MPQIFHRSLNSVFRACFVGSGLMVVGLFWCLWVFYFSPYVTRQHQARIQPVPFSHAHHVGQLGIDCRYCHTSVEESSFAGIPPTETCMNCHQQVWFGSEMLEPVRASFERGDVIAWKRIHNLPDFVYFNHSIHVAKGIGCVSCHGRVDKMPLMEQAHSLSMEWCLDCHRSPERHLRPESEVVSMIWTPSETTNPENGDLYDSKSLGERLFQEYEISSSNSLTSCSTCHR